MNEPSQSAPTQIVVVPRPLKDFFYNRLTERFTGRDDVKVVVDRRFGERRRQGPVTGPGPLGERRRKERRDVSVAWSINDMPFAVS